MSSPFQTGACSRKKSSRYRSWSSSAPSGLIWKRPRRKKKRWVRQHYGLSIPEDAMDDDIEESARFYEEDNGDLHIRSDFLVADFDEPRQVRVAFIVNQANEQLRSHGVLFSIHDETVPAFRAAAPARAPHARPADRRARSAAQAL